MNTVEIISQGDEVITGQTIDTNAAWLSEQLVLLGFDVVRHSTVPDRIADIEQVLKDASQRSDLVLCSGGLGPTDDDLTAEAVANVCAKKLVYDALAMGLMKGMFSRLNRKMVKANEKQVWLPEGATRIDNYWGTAPGFYLQLNRAMMAFLPGVPGEMKAMFEQELKPTLLKQFNLKPQKLVTFRTTGLGESNLQEKIGKFSYQNVSLSYRAMGREVQVKLRFSPLCSTEDYDTRSEAMRITLSDCLFAIEGWGNEPEGCLASVVAALLAEKHLSLTCAESASAGAFVRLLNSSSQTVAPVKRAYFFEEGADLAGMLHAPESEGGNVNYFCLAKTLRETSQSDLALIITEFEGVKDENDALLVQRSQIYLVSKSEQLRIDDQVTGSKEYSQHAISTAALNLLRSHLLRQG